MNPRVALRAEDGGLVGKDDAYLSQFQVVCVTQATTAGIVRPTLSFACATRRGRVGMLTVASSRARLRRSSTVRAALTG